LEHEVVGVRLLAMHGIRGYGHPGEVVNLVAEHENIGM
jgi:hypothetical protein